MTGGMNPESVDRENPCFDVGSLRHALTVGAFAESGDTLRAMAHFARPCDRCWHALEALAADTGWSCDLESLSRAAQERFRELPVAAVLGRWVARSRGTGEEAALPPTHRHLLGQACSGGPFVFRWLLAEEARSLSLMAAEPEVARWRTLAATLRQHPCGTPELDRELALLIRAYEGDEARVAGRPEAARRCLAEALAGARHSRPAIRATIYEMQSDYHRRAREPRQALLYLHRADPLLEGLEIPGRLAETRTRIGMAHLLLGELEQAATDLRDALALIPGGTDPRLRLDILLHLAATAMRLDETPSARRYLEQAEPFFDRYGSALMAAQRDWLWGRIHLDSGKMADAEESFLRALAYFDEQDAPLAQMQVLGDLYEVYLRTGREAEGRPTDRSNPGESA